MLKIPPSPGSAADLDATALTDLALMVFRLNGTLLHWGDALVEPLGLTSARWQMLGAIALAGTPLTAPQIGDAMGVTRQGAQKQLNLLLDLGLVAAGQNPAHQRSPLYTLTARGRRLYERAIALWFSQITALADDIPTADALAATSVLDRMLRHLDPSIRSREAP